MVLIPVLPSLLSGAFEKAPSLFSSLEGFSLLENRELGEFVLGTILLSGEEDGMAEIMEA